MMNNQLLSLWCAESRVVDSSWFIFYVICCIFGSMLRIYCLGRNSTSLWFALFNLGHKRYIQCTNHNVLELLKCQENLNSCVYVSVCMYFQRNAQETYSFVISLNFIYPFWFFREMSINHILYLIQFMHIFLFLALYLENLTVSQCTT